MHEFVLYEKFSFLPLLVTVIHIVNKIFAVILKMINAIAFSEVYELLMSWRMLSSQRQFANKKLNEESCTNIIVSFVLIQCNFR